jgi:hypothetical protein
METGMANWQPSDPRIVDPVVDRRGTEPLIQTPRRSGGWWIVTALAIVAIILVVALSFDSTGPGSRRNTAQNEVVAPQVVDQNQPNSNIPNTDSGTGSTSLPAQPVKPEQPQGGNTIQP